MMDLMYAEPLNNLWPRQVCGLI